VTFTTSSVFFFEQEPCPIPLHQWQPTAQGTSNRQRIRAT
jgi:hypothetical protein